MDDGGRGPRGLQVFAALATVAAVAPWAVVAVTSSSLPGWLYAVGVVGWVLTLVLLPLLALPTAAGRGSVAVHRGRLVARTTRGRRELSLRRLARVRGTDVPGRIDGSVLLWLRDLDGQALLLVGRTSRRPVPTSVTAAVRALDRRAPRRVSRGARRALGLDPEPGVLASTLRSVVRTLAQAVVLVAVVALYLTGLVAVAGAPR